MEPLVTDVEEHRFTREEFQRMIDTGVFDGDEDIELLNGRLVVVPPQGPPHTFVSSDLRDRLIAALSNRHVREGKPLDCGPLHVPEPDLAVVRGTARDFVARDPRGDETLLVVEISRTTQRRDRAKAAIYAQAGVPVYWMVDIAARCIEVHTGPVGERYRLVQVKGEDEELEVPEASVRWLVRDLLPPR
jgi:Uma2 family endonuclease